VMLLTMLLLQQLLLVLLLVLLPALLLLLVLTSLRNRHMRPAEARRLLASGGSSAAAGRVICTPEEGEPRRVNYRIYREASEHVEDVIRAECASSRGCLFGKGYGKDGEIYSSWCPCCS